MQEHGKATIQTWETFEFLYFYTPLCGTCTLASQMVTIVEQTQTLQVLAINLNHFPNFAQLLQIEQVPCLIHHATVTKLYTFANVVNVYNFCQKNTNQKE